MCVRVCVSSSCDVCVWHRVCVYRHRVMCVCVSSSCVCHISRVCVIISYACVCNVVMCVCMRVYVCVRLQLFLRGCIIR